MRQAPTRFIRRPRWLWIGILAAVLGAVCLISALALTGVQDGPVFTTKLVSDQTSPGSEVRVQVFVSPGDRTAGAFLVSCTYDTEAFDYVEVEKSQQLVGSDVFTYQANPLRTVYTCDTTQGGAPLLSGNILTYVFRTHDDAPEETFRFSLHVEQVYDYDANALPDSSPPDLQVTVERPESSSVASVLSAASSNPSSRASSTNPTSSANSSSEASSQVASPRLTMLQPSQGTLSPAFNPEQFQYELTVPATCSEVFFSTAPQNAQISTEISRYTLNAAGNDTLITATVKSSDGKAKTVYTVVVHRLLPGTSEASALLPKLTSLQVRTPANTGLTPAFSPDTLQYEMTVASSISEVAFDYHASDGAAVLVNRYTLQAAGSDTLITLTVSSGDTDAKTIYRIIVHRLVANGAGASSQKQTGSSKNNTSSRKSTTANKSSSSKKSSSARTSSKKTSSAKSSSSKKSSSKNARSTLSTPSGEAYIAGQVSGIGTGKGLSLTNQGQSDKLNILLVVAVLAISVITVLWLILHRRNRKPPDDGHEDPTGRPPNP